MKKVSLILIFLMLFFVTGCFGEDTEPEEVNNGQEEQVEYEPDEGEIEQSNLHEEAKETFIIEELVYPNSYITDEIIDEETFENTNYAWQLVIPIGLSLEEVVDYYESLAVENDNFKILNDDFDYTFGEYEGNITFGEHPTVDDSFEVWVHIREKSEQ